MGILNTSPTIASTSRLAPSEEPGLQTCATDSAAWSDPQVFEKDYSKLAGDMEKSAPSATTASTTIVNRTTNSKPDLIVVHQILATSQLDHQTDSTSTTTTTTTTTTPTSTDTVNALQTPQPQPLPVPSIAQHDVAPSEPTLQPSITHPQQLTSLTSEKPQHQLYASSGISVLSTSGTLVSGNTTLQPTMATAPAHPSPIPQTTTAQTIVSDPAVYFDRLSFKTVFQDLVQQTEQFETLNDQMLDAMTEFDETRLGLGLLAGDSSAEENRLEERRQRIARAVTDQVVAAWPSLSRPTLMTEQNEGHGQQARAEALQDARMHKQRIKAMNQLKNATVAFWSAQNHFSERAQLVLDIFQDSSELEREEGVRILRSRHLNNLLSSSPTPRQIDELTAKFKANQETLENIMEPMHTVLLSIVVTIGETERAVLLSSAQTRSEEKEPSPSLGKRLLQMGKVKQQAFKRMIQSW